MRDTLLWMAMSLASVSAVNLEKDWKVGLLGFVVSAVFIMARAYLKKLGYLKEVK